jgi:hypothetical protein
VVESGTLLGTEGSQKAVFDQAQSHVGGGERFFACRGELDDVTSPVGGDRAVA